MKLRRWLQLRRVNTKDIITHRKGRGRVGRGRDLVLLLKLGRNSGEQMMIRSQLLNIRSSSRWCNQGNKRVGRGNVRTKPPVQGNSASKNNLIRRKPRARMLVAITEALDKRETTGPAVANAMIKNHGLEV